MILIYITILQWFFAVCFWQIEEIWRSLQMGWAYNLPFGCYTTDYWFAHDFIFVACWIAFIVQGAITVYVTVKK